MSLDQYRMQYLFLFPCPLEILNHLQQLALDKFPVTKWDHTNATGWSAIAKASKGEMSKDLLYNPASQKVLYSTV